MDEANAPHDARDDVLRFVLDTRRRLELAQLGGHIARHVPVCNNNPPPSSSSVSCSASCKCHTSLEYPNTPFSHGSREAGAESARWVT
jgi:hypothetical protein